MMSIKKQIQHSSLSLGMAAIGIYALTMATNPSLALPSAVLAVLLAFVAGFFNAAIARFFAGLTLALVCWICFGLLFGTESERTSAIVIVPAILIMAFGLGAVGFFAGRLTGWIGKAISTRCLAG